MSSSSLAGRYHNWNGKSFEFGQPSLKFWIKLLTILVQRMPNLFAGLVVDNANVIGSFGSVCNPTTGDSPQGCSRDVGAIQNRPTERLPNEDDRRL